jgi:hypothetical protein
MQINDLPTSNITEAKGAVAVAEPPKPASAPKPVTAPKGPADKKETASGAAAVTAAKAGAKTEVSDVKPTGETTTEGEPTFTLKVNGQDIVATQSQIIALAQKAKGAEVAFKQKAEIEKLAADFLDNFDKDAFGLLVKRHGKEKAKEIAIGMVKNLIAEEQKSPEQVELETLRAENETHKQAQERVKKEQEEAQRKVKQQVLYVELLKSIDTELSATHLPKDKLTLTRVLNYLAAGKKANGASWTVKEAVQVVEAEDMSHATHYAKRYVEGLLPSEQFRKIFGDDALKKLNKEQIEGLKKADKIAKNTQPVGETAQAEVPRKRTLSKNRGAEGMSEREWRRQHGSLGGI